MKRNKIHVVEGATGKKLCEVDGNRIVDAALSPNRNTLAAIHNEISVMLMDVASGMQVARWDLDRQELVRGQPWLLPRLAFAPGGRLLAIGTPAARFSFGTWPPAGRFTSWPGTMCPSPSWRFLPMAGLWRAPTGTPRF